MKKIIAMLLIAMLISACTAQESIPDEIADVKTELTMGYTTEPEGLDPHRTAAASTFTVTNNIYDTLVGVMPQLGTEPRLANE